MIQDAHELFATRQIKKSDKDFKRTIAAWSNMLRSSWGLDYILAPEIELNKIFTSVSTGFAVGKFSPKGLLMAAQAVNRGADPTEWKYDRMYWSAVVTHEGWRNQGLCKDLYKECAAYMGTQTSQTTWVPFENLQLVPFLLKRGWRFPEDHKELWCRNEGGKIGLFMYLSPEALNQYLSEPF